MFIHLIFIYVAIKDAKHVNTSRGFQLVIGVLGLQGLEAWPLGWFEKKALLSALVAGQFWHPSRTPRYQTMSAISYILLHHHIFQLFFCLSSHLSLFFACRVPLFVIFWGVDPPWVVNFAQLSEKTPIFPGRLDSTGDVIAAKASGQLLCRSLDITLKETGPGCWGAKEVFEDLFRRIQAFSGFDPFIIYNIIYFGTKMERPGF